MDAPSPVERDSGAPAVVLEGVAKSYPGPAPVHALRPCRLRVERGDYLAVMGPSGSGKSTLLNILGLLDSPTEGTYLLGGRDVSALSEGERTHIRATRIGFVFQFFHLLAHYTAAENVQLGLLYGRGVPRRERRAVAETGLSRVGLAERFDADASTLSGGERQRVAIARALVHQPDLLLCDEPTGNLDSATSRSILDLVDELHAQGLTVVVVTHDPEVARRATRLVTIHDGVLAEAEARASGGPG